MNSYEKQPIQKLVDTQEFHDHLLFCLSESRVGREVAAKDDDGGQTVLSVATCELGALHLYAPKQPQGVPFGFAMQVEFDETLSGLNPDGSEIKRSRQGRLKGAAFASAEFDDLVSAEFLTTAEEIVFTFDGLEEILDR